MDFSDDRWVGLLGGYRTPYDPRPTLSELFKCPGSGMAWIALWEELHHQGDVGVASYAAVPAIAQIARADSAGDWNPYALAATIEEARWSPSNPDLPAWLTPAYEEAWVVLFDCALSLLQHTKSENAIASAISVIAIHKGQRNLARLSLLTEDERAETLATAGWG